MKWLVLVFILCVGVFAFHVHRRSVEDAEAVAREQALEEGRRESAAQLAAERASHQKELEERARAEALRAAARRPIMAVSKVLEPLLISVQAPLNVQEPADLVPMIELTKQRILDKRVRAEPQRQPVFDHATVVLDQLTALAEQRTIFLEAMLRNRSTSSTLLDRPNAGSNSSFFNLNTVKRWDETLARARPTLLLRMEQLRTAEREWNKQVDPNNDLEVYDVAGFAPLLIPAEQVSQSSLSTTAKPSATPNRIWRRSYYNTYGYPNYPYFPSTP